MKKSFVLMGIPLFKTVELMIEFTDEAREQKFRQAHELLY
ncbi:hypothetical protein LCGC14_2525530 [marine sediment metagenome]|uniref:Uncharacterized protein n=1 Tax=marine sediment metagenome TaxID=412755 RepID=A0A0F9AVJ3_9ZZZZ|nr:MAG: hypothetical protein HeimC3_51620 [Candidatus Heimdallarchaeota archaeon LC_3]